MVQAGIRYGYRVHGTVLCRMRYESWSCSVSCWTLCNCHRFGRVAGDLYNLPHISRNPRRSRFVRPLRLVQLSSPRASDCQGGLPSEDVESHEGHGTPGSTLKIPADIFKPPSIEDMIAPVDTADADRSDPSQLIVSRLNSRPHHLWTTPASPHVIKTSRVHICVWKK